MPVFDLKVHQEISRWKQEAREEDNERYFFSVPEVATLLSGDASFLIDRKGKGKTAVGQSILRQAQLGDSLSFKNYPFNELYRSLRDTGFKPANQYIAGWRFVIFSTLARLMARDEAVDKQKRAVVQKAFAGDVNEALYAKFARWLSGGFKVEAYGFGVGFEVARDFMDTGRSLTERADILGAFLVPELAKSGSKYYIVFDELDEDYTSAASAQDRAEYFALVTNLLKAVRLIRTDVRFKNVFPIVLLRDDIYGLLQDPDREKWMDSGVSITWPEKRIKDLLAYRLCRAARVPLKSFDKIWKDLVGSSPSFTTPNRVWDKLDFIASYTLGRPRDYIYYLSHASKLICDRLERQVGSATLSQEVLRACVGPFAAHLRRELEDEMSGQLPYIRDVMNIVLTFSGRHFRFDEFKTAYEQARVKAHQEWGDVESVLDTLYSFSAIGFVKPGGAEYYRYQAPIVELDRSRTMVLHKGLIAARRPS